MRLRTALWFTSVLLLAAGAAVATTVLPRMPALRCLRHFETPVPADRDPSDPPPEGWRRLTEPERFGVRRAWVRAPDGPGPHPCLVFVHGVAPVGIDDGRVLRAVEAFRRAGFCVVAPELRFMVDPTERDEDEDRLLALLRAVARGEVPEAHPRRLGLVGVSVGGAVALRAAARWLSAGSAELAGVLCIGTPEDIRRPAKDWYALPNPDPQGGASLAWKRRNVAAFARSYGARAALRKRLGAHADARRLAAWLKAHEVPEAAPAGLESEAGRAFASFVLAGPETWTAGRERLLADAWDQLLPFSPADWAEELIHLAGVSVLLLHGEGDPLVSVEELEPLRRRLARHTNVSALRSRLVGHTSVGEVGWAEKLDHLVFMQSFFDLVRR